MQHWDGIRTGTLLLDLARSPCCAAVIGFFIAMVYDN